RMGVIVLRTSLVEKGVRLICIEPYRERGLVMTRINILAVASALVVQCALAQTTSATNTRTIDLTTFGLGSTETARVNLTNVASNSTNGTAASCTGSVSFINAAGTAVGTATSFTIASGVTSSVSLPFANSGLTAPRGTLRAQV